MPISIVCINGNCQFCDGCDHDCHTDQPSLFDPVRPYIQDGQPSAGYAKGADTSKAGEPNRASAQGAVLDLVRQRGTKGVTGLEASLLLDRPRLTTAACLSVLHGDGLVERLSGNRNGHKVYVAPEAVDGRPTEQRGSHGRSVCPHCGGDL